MSLVARRNAVGVSKVLYRELMRDKLRTIKVVRLLTGFSLKETVRVTEKAILIVECEDEHERFMEEFRNAGGIVEKVSAVLLPTKRDRKRQPKEKNGSREPSNDIPF